MILLGKFSETIGFWDTKETEQHELITLRLEAFYSMNKNIRIWVKQ